MAGYNVNEFTVRMGFSRKEKQLVLGDGEIPYKHRMEFLDFNDLLIASGEGEHEFQETARAFASRNAHDALADYIKTTLGI